MREADHKLRLREKELADLQVTKFPGAANDIWPANDNRGYFSDLLA